MEEKSNESQLLSDYASKKHSQQSQIAHMLKLLLIIGALGLLVWYFEGR